MAKLSTIIIAGVSGAAAAIFLASPKGKEFTAKTLDFISDLKEDPQAVKEQLLQSANEFSAQANETFTSVKEKVEAGEINSDSVVDYVKGKSQEVSSYSQDRIAEIKELLSQENLSTSELLNQVKEKVAQFSDKKEAAEEILLELPDQIDEGQVAPEASQE